MGIWRGQPKNHSRQEDEKLESLVGHVRWMDSNLKVLMKTGIVKESTEVYEK